MKSIKNWEVYHENKKTPLSLFNTETMILTLEQFKNQLTTEKLTDLVAHMDEIYECKKLEDREIKMCYLAYLWKNKKVVTNEMGYDIPDAALLGIDLFEDYEIAFEAGEDEDSGVNLGVLHDYYVFQELEKLV
jgi:hypothetical protein